jgi:hypothetical protein
MSHHQSLNYLKSPTSQSQASPTQEIVASSAQNPRLDEITDGPAYPKDVIELVMSQPVLKDQMEGIYRQLGRGEDISSALQKARKRGIKEVSDLDVPPPSKKPKLKKPKVVSASQTVPDQNKREQEKPQKEKPKATCVACPKDRHIGQFPMCLPSSSCNHKREMCRICIIASIRIEVLGGIMPHCALCKGTISYGYGKGITKRNGTSTFSPGKPRAILVL